MPSDFPGRKTCQCQFSYQNIKFFKFYKDCHTILDGGINVGRVYTWYFSCSSPHSLTFPPHRLPLVLGNATFQYDWIVILGGTNDILHVKNFADDEEFLNQLENVWQPRITKDIEKLHSISYRYATIRVVMLVLMMSMYGMGETSIKIQYYLPVVITSYKENNKTEFCSYKLNMFTDIKVAFNFIFRSWIRTWHGPLYLISSKARMSR